MKEEPTKGPEEVEKPPSGSGMPHILQKDPTEEKHKKEKPKEVIPAVDPKKVDQALETANKADQDVKDLKKRLDKVEDRQDDQQKQIDGTTPLWMIAVPILVMAIVAAAYSGEYAYHPLRTLMVVAVSGAVAAVAVGLYLWRRNKREN